MLRYLRGLARVVERLGVKLYTGTHVTSVDDGPFVTVKTDQGHTVTAEQVVVATNSPVTDMVAMHTKQAPYRTYVIAMPVASSWFPKACTGTWQIHITIADCKKSTAIPRNKCSS